jgi:hypothetical protein
MRCIFCKQVSDNSTSVEHIIPESLGNCEHILFKGIVCDSCNKYFAVKIEKPVLENPYFISVRHRNFIKNKKNSIPSERAFIAGDTNVFIDVNDGSHSIIIEDSNTINKIINGKVTSMIVPFYNSPDLNDRDMSRFLGKMALECLAYRGKENLEWLNEITDKSELDDLRFYVRFGNKPDFWKYNQRRIYNEEDMFLDEKYGQEPFEILHEFTLVYTDSLELYFVINIMGIEYAINFGEPNIDGYKKWLMENNNASPLFDPLEKVLSNKKIIGVQTGDKMNFVKRLHH